MEIRDFCSQIQQLNGTIDSALADPGGAPPARAPKGPDSFVLTYEFFET